MSYRMYCKHTWLCKWFRLCLMWFRSSIVYIEISKYLYHVTIFLQKYFILPEINDQILIEDIDSPISTYMNLYKKFKPFNRNMLLFKHISLNVLILRWKHLQLVFFICGCVGVYMCDESSDELVKRPKPYLILSDKM